MIGRAQLALILKSMMVAYIISGTANCGVPTRLDELYKMVFENYSSSTLPVFSSHDILTVRLTAYAININQFDEMSGELSLTMAFTLTWMDPRLSWTSSDYNNITSFPVNTEELWRPQVYLLQSSETLVDIADSAVQARLHRDGKIVWNTGKVIKVACSVDVKYFPFDTQTCFLTLLNWALLEDEMRLAPMKTSIQQFHLNRNTQWELRPSTLSSCKKSEYENMPCLALRFILRRRCTFYVVYILVPLILLGLTNNIVFLMPASSGERTSVSVTIFLSFVVCMDVVNDVVPQSSQPMAYIYMYIVYLIVYSSVTLLLCVISLRIYNRDSKISNTVRTIIWYARFKFIRSKISPQGKSDVNSIDQTSWTNVDNMVRLDSLAPEEHDRDMTGNKCTGKEPNSSHQKEAKDKQVDFRSGLTWDVVGKTFDFYCFVVLYIVFIVLSMVIFESLRQNKGLNS